MIPAFDGSFHWIDGVLFENLEETTAFRALEVEAGTSVILSSEGPELGSCLVSPIKIRGAISQYNPDGETLAPRRRACSGLFAGTVAAMISVDVAIGLRSHR